MGTCQRTTSDSSSPSHKRLRSNCSDPTSAADSGPAPSKRTRDLPDLSECHSCSFRTDASKGRNRLQALYSEWRIVLLCKRCFSRVESSEICSYCFKEASQDCFSCAQCKHSVHKTCFLQNKSVAPWSYSCCGGEFSVCIDCWVPKHIAKLRALSNSKKSRKSRASHTAGSPELLENAVKDANCESEKMTEVGTRAKQMVVKRVVDARLAKLANNALFMDAELSAKLERTLNNSSMALSKSSPSLRTPTFLKPVNKVYMRRRKNDECRQICSMGMWLTEGRVSCSSKLVNTNVDENWMKSDAASCDRQAGARSDGKRDRFFYKYSRKKLSFKAALNSETNFLSEGPDSETQGSSVQPLGSLTFSVRHSCSLPLQSLVCASDLS